ncbi:MAG: pyridoxamine 5'-phosphate oxidase family protein [Vulcanimicrobiaceae bacterium]
MQTPAETSAASLVAGCRWLALATIADSGTPSVSYAPFALVAGGFAIAVSRLSKHTADLTARPAASVLLAADGATPDAYARPRLAVEVTARSAPRDSAPSRAIWDALQERHGETVSILRRLPDFETLTLEPEAGRLVAGFAAAHDLDAASLQRILAAAASAERP